MQRRQFLQSTAAMAGVAALPGLQQTGAVNDPVTGSIHLVYREGYEKPTLRGRPLAAIDVYFLGDEPESGDKCYLMRGRKWSTSRHNFCLWVVSPSELPLDHTALISKCKNPRSLNLCCCDSRRFWPFSNIQDRFARERLEVRCHVTVFRRITPVRKSDLASTIRSDRFLNGLMDVDSWSFRCERQKRTYYPVLPEIAATV